ncbi:MAG: hypothetical protein KBH39_13705, partial [Chitinophagales bacterium]|nr:hypothetical protein [Chitinophagales bacterium]
KCSHECTNKNTNARIKNEKCINNNLLHLFVHSCNINIRAFVAAFLKYEYEAYYFTCIRGRIFLKSFEAT